MVILSSKTFLPERAGQAAGRLLGKGVPEVALREDSISREGKNMEQEEGADRKTQRP
jgi:hypothetical protein